MNLSQAYFCGAWMPLQDAHIPLSDVGFGLGVTVVERLRTFAGRPFRVDEHLKRLQRSLEIVGWNAATIVAEVREAVVAFPDVNAELMAPGDDWYIAVFVTPGDLPTATQPRIGVHGGALPFAGWADKFETGVEVVITDVRQTPANCWPPELKCRSRMHYYLADQEAARRQPGARAVLLDQQGFVGEASTANVVAYYADRGIVTPRIGGVLPGISQQVLFELADTGKIAHIEADLTPQEFAAADELFITSTSICLQPIVRVDGKAVGGGFPGPVYRQLLDAWSKKVGVDIASQARQFAVR
ncbi:Branched-chain-amino-acid aminotransferase [Lacipirellula limnantheis]|uniref:branched-chain-amino-acid transaminase n=2 Tax=Lacipirellula limnantheis TaxID=2528024 RepID=A0A517TVZ7_9BACT|nr:Branched-chain-amino-acid aminotransferase [Lacipirellula limnantheis]